MTANTWISLAEDAVQNGMVFLLLTGGEIFLRQDFFEIYEPLTQLGIFITLFTNGTLITNPIASRLSQNPPKHIEITLYGATAQTYDIVTKSTGGYSRCCNGIETLLKHQIPLVLKTTLTQQNIHELDAIRKMAHNWEIPFYADWLLSKRRDGNFSDIDTCRLSALECINLEANDSATANSWIESSLRKSPDIFQDNFYCNAGKSSFVVTPTGEMNVCLDLAMPVARPLDIGFDLAWQQLQDFVDNAPTMSKVCQNCDVNHYCPRCPAWSFLENNTLSDPVPYLCEIAIERNKQYYSQV